MKRELSSALAALLSALAAPAAFAGPATPPAAGAAAPPASPEVAVSSEAVKVFTVNDLYTPTRDPFHQPNAPGGGGAPLPTEPFRAENFNIHNLNLKGIMRDKDGSYAVMVDSQYQLGFVLKGGQVYDFKNKKIPGITGTIQPRQRTVVLITADKDVQTLRLGEVAEDATKPGT